MSDDQSEEMSMEEYEYTFEPIFDLAERWDISEEEAEVFLEQVGYFDTEQYHEIAEKFDPTPRPNGGEA